MANNLQFTLLIAKISLILSLIFVEVVGQNHIDLTTQLRKHKGTTHIYIFTPVNVCMCISFSRTWYGRYIMWHGKHKITDWT